MVEKEWSKTATLNSWKCSLAQIEGLILGTFRTNWWEIFFLRNKNFQDLFLELTLDFFHFQSSRGGGLEVEQWSDNRTLSILVDQSPLGAHDYMAPLDPLCYVRHGCVLYVCVCWKTTLLTCGSWVATQSSNSWLTKPHIKIRYTKSL